MQMCVGENTQVTERPGPRTRRTTQDDSSPKATVATSEVYLCPVSEIVSLDVVLDSCCVRGAFVNNRGREFLTSAKQSGCGASWIKMLAA